LQATRVAGAQVRCSGGHLPPEAQEVRLEPTKSGSFRARKALRKCRLPLVFSRSTPSISRGDYYSSTILQVMVEEIVDDSILMAIFDDETRVTAELEGPQRRGGHAAPRRADDASGRARSLLQPRAAASQACCESQPGAAAAVVGGAGCSRAPWPRQRRGGQPGTIHRPVRGILSDG
jgi:hypothetical protein